MAYIDEKFKACAPEETVENIVNILNKVGINTQYTSYDSGMVNCYSARVEALGGFPGTNGKGVTPAFAKASAYAEFIERLQTGLFTLKYQDLDREPDINLHKFAPDAKYMTREELVENGEWMDYIIEEYKELGLSRESIAEICVIYEGGENVLTIPYYSFFEKKYVYLPVAFVKKVYSTNGCCAGNNRDEAWVHAMSEILERHACIKMLTSGTAAPKIPDETLRSFTTVYSMIEKLRSMNYEVDVLDFSYGIDCPIIATRIINKQTGGYRVHVGADPILEIAITRSFTESFQGRMLENFSADEKYRILKDVNEVVAEHNVSNQLERGDGLFTIDFFSEEISCDKKFDGYTDNSSKSNHELLYDMLHLYKSIGKPLYIRNCSFLGFPSYFFVVPGFSEGHITKLDDIKTEYYLASNGAKALRNIEKADIISINSLLISQMIYSDITSRANNYIYRSGIPLALMHEHSFLMYIHLAYTAYKQNLNDDLCKYLAQASNMGSCGSQDVGYVRLLSNYFKMKTDNIAPEKIDVLLKRFHSADDYRRFKQALSDNNLFDNLLLRCDMKNCTDCHYKYACRLDELRKIVQTLGKEFSKFTDGQNEEHFKVDFEI